MLRAAASRSYYSATWRRSMAVFSPIPGEGEKNAMRVIRHIRILEESLGKKCKKDSFVREMQAAFFSSCNPPLCLNSLNAWPGRRPSATSLSSRPVKTFGRGQRPQEQHSPAISAECALVVAALHTRHKKTQSLSSKQKRSLRLPHLHIPNCFLPPFFRPPHPSPRALPSSPDSVSLVLTRKITSYALLEPEDSLREPQNGLTFLDRVTNRRVNVC